MHSIGCNSAWRVLGEKVVYPSYSPENPQGRAANFALVVLQFAISAACGSE